VTQAARCLVRALTDVGGAAHSLSAIMFTECVYTPCRVWRHIDSCSAVATFHLLIRLPVFFLNFHNFFRHISCKFRWLKCNGMQRNAVSHLQFLVQGVPQGRPSPKSHDATFPFPSFSLPPLLPSVPSSLSHFPLFPAPVLPFP